MASSKKIGFFCDEEKITLVEFEKNASLHVISAPLGLKTNNTSPFSSNFTEEIQITAVLQKMLQDNRIVGGSFYVSLPMKEVILRSFAIPFVKQDDIHNAVKFEAKKYLPIDIQDLAFVFHTVPFVENDTRRLQIIFFAVRKESLARYERILKQVNVTVFYGEPCVVSLAKVLLFKKEIKPTDHLPFLNLDKNSGHICFIDQGIPQFIREFSISPHSQIEKANDSVETLNLRIVNEVANSFDFYARQFRGEKMEQLLFSAESAGQDLLNALEAELKLKLRKVSPLLSKDALSDDMDTIYAMGACLEPPLAALSGFNFFGDKVPKSKLKSDLVGFLKSYKEIIFVSLICVISLVGVYALFQVQLKVAQQQYDQLSSKLGASLNLPVDSVQTELSSSMTKLAAYKKIRTKSDMVLILFRVASHLPQGALLKELDIGYEEGDADNIHVTINMIGNVFKEDPNEEIAVVNRIFSDFKHDKELSRFIKSVGLVSLSRDDVDGRQVTKFNIHCS